MKNKNVIERILRYHPSMPDYEGCDGYKAGSGEDECKGVVCALVPTVEVIQKCAEAGCNLIITHEPSFYMTPDFPEWRGPFINRVYDEKRKLLQDAGITIWRDHDHIHAHQPDGIFTGVLKYLGWERYYKPNALDIPFYYPCEIPQMTVKDLRSELMEKLHLNGLRYIGDQNAKVSRVALCAHLFPNGFCSPTERHERTYLDYATLLIREMERENGIEVLIPGEIIEWDILSYIRDAVALGKNKACMNIGHFNLEELGMRYMADWLGELLNGEVLVNYLHTGDIFLYR